MACVPQSWSGLVGPEASIKENPGGRSRGGLGAAALLVLWLAPLGALQLAVWLDHALPPPLPRTAPPHVFSAERARDLLLNLTTLGPRVTGSYENEVSAVAVLVAALRQLAPPPGPHGGARLDIDVQRADGAFTIDFLDGMSNIYRGVQSVVARVSPAGAGGKTGRAALLLNCHFDTVPDSAGAGDDAAGCAVMLETARALLAAPAQPPARHDLLLLFNGAEENIMQASHAFVTQHPWARRAVCFINLEACGAGGRELLFQSTRGAGAGALLRQYAARAPRPFASSLAQEIFSSGLVPADTDFRIFRDYGGMVGVDLAWSSDGYAYHTALDAAPRMPPAALQRAGDNVLALVSGLLASEELPSREGGAGAEETLVYFDVVGVWMAVAGAGEALLLAAATLLLVAARLYLNARDAAKQLLLPRAAWGRLVLREAARLLLAAAAGLLAAASLALALHHAGLRLCWYARPWLLAPLYGAPALAAALLVLLAAGGTPGGWWRGRMAGDGTAGGWWRGRMAGDGLAALWAAGLVAGLLLRLRSAYVPGLWAAGLALAGLLPRALPGPFSERRAACWWAALALLPTLQALYVAQGALALFVPLAGRAGPGGPPDLLLALLAAALALAAAAPPAALLAAHSRRAVLVLLAALCGACALALLGGALLPRYTPQHPQRYMLFHVRRTLHEQHVPHEQHAPHEQHGEPELLYWLPALDVNTPDSVVDHVPAMAGARDMSRASCERLLYCGAPYFLPALSLLPRGRWLPAPAPPAAVLACRVTPRRRDERQLDLDIELVGPAHIVVIVSPGEGVRLSNCSLVDAPRAGPSWRGRPSYMLTLADAAAGEAPARWRLTLALEHAPGAPRPRDGWVALSMAGHAMFGPAQRTSAHQRLLEQFPPWTQVTGWGVDMHLYTV